MEVCECFHPQSELKRGDMEAKVTWERGLTFTGTADSGFDIRLDSKKAVGGDESGFTPTELIAVGVAGCTAMDVISILMKKRQQISNFEVLVHATRAVDHPRKFTDMTIEYRVTGKSVDPAAVDRAIDLSESKYCSAIATLRGNVNFDKKVVILEG
jgi:putative redox protein